MESCLVAVNSSCISLRLTLPNCVERLATDAHTKYRKNTKVKVVFLKLHGIQFCLRRSKLYLLSTSSAASAAAVSKQCLGTGRIPTSNPNHNGALCCRGNPQVLSIIGSVNSSGSAMIELSPNINETVAFST